MVPTDMVDDINKYLSGLIILAREVEDKLRNQGQGGVELLAEYVDRLNSVGDAIASADQNILKSLALVHQNLLQQAESAKSDIRVHLIRLNKRGQGLRAYLDPHPKRISLRRPRKG